MQYKIIRDEDGRIKGLKKESSRRNFLKNSGLFCLAVSLLYLGLRIKDEESPSNYLEEIGKGDKKNEVLYKNNPKIKEKWDNYHTSETEELEEVIFNEYDDKITEPRDTFDGRYKRTKRFEDKIKEVEEKYNIPENLIFALIMRESYGDPLTVNEKDGGSGLGCLQPRIAKHYGLKTYNNKRFMISKNYGEELSNLVKKYNNNLDELKKIHEPFDPDKCILVIGEFLSDLYLYKELGDWDKVTAAYNCGIDNVIKNDIPSITKRHLATILEYKKRLDLIKRFE